MTDMRDYEIVLGKMLGSLLPMLILLAVTLPVFAFTLLLGGVSVGQLVQVAILLFAATVAGGSLGGLIALWRDRTFQSLALSVLAIVLFLCLTQSISAVGPMITPTFAGWSWDHVQAGSSRSWLCEWCWNRLPTAQSRLRMDLPWSCSASVYC